MDDHDLITEYPVELLATDGRRLDAIFRLDEAKPTLALLYPGRHLEFSCVEDTFETFCTIREKLETEGLRPLCYGACLNVFPSAMSSDMGGDIKAYKLTLGQQGRIADLVDIFESAPDIEPVTVAEQAGFYDRWLESLGKR
jgi:hypothetical protein